MSIRQPSYIQMIVHELYVNIFKKSTSELRYIIYLYKHIFNLYYNTYIIKIYLL